MTKSKTLALAMAVGSLAVSGPVQAACWTPAAADAAAVRDLQSRLMVAALRCVKSDHDLLPDYNRFVRTHKPLLKMGNHVLKSHFAKGTTKKNAQRKYDRYAVSLANKYGAGSGDLSECSSMKKLAGLTLDSGGQQAKLVKLAQDHALSPNLPHGRCGIVLASKD